MRTTSQIENINGYFKGLSSPSGTERIMAFFVLPVSNSAGQTRLPTFSSTTKSRSFVPNSRIPCLVMSASRWHIPPVWIWMARTPVSLIACASTSESISASMTPIFISSLSMEIVRFNVVVFPAPGEDIRFNKNVPSDFNSARNLSASALLSSKILRFTSITLKSFICSPSSLLLCSGYPMFPCQIPASVLWYNQIVIYKTFYL